MMKHLEYPLGAHQLENGSTHFLVWAPKAAQVDLHLLRQDTYIPMQALENGYYAVTVPDVNPGDQYFYRLDGEKERPDPTSRYQPDGVHGASAVIDPSFDWDDQGWCLPSMRNMVFYELHVGTFTPEGTFEAIIPHLPRLKEFGITTLELMPIGQFPGSRNWGYDGVQLYAAQNSYGGPDGLRRLVNAAHQHGLAVFLDVVYNHLGPEGNYLWDYGHYFNARYQGFWGDSLNFDAPHSDEVRRFFIENAIYWLRDCHIDGYRLDATHALFDFSARPFLKELTTAIHDWADQHNRQVMVIAENDQSDRSLLLPPQMGGTGLDALWLDDLHHILHVTYTGEQAGYYADFNFGLMEKLLREGFTRSGGYSQVRGRRHGTYSGDIPSDQFVVAIQNHDQVGNRMLGERLTDLTDFAGLKLAAGFLLTSPYVPLLFMGEEYGETAPFLYFISHGDPDLVKAVQRGRAEEFADFQWAEEPPDPAAEATFERSKLNHNLRDDGWHAILYRFYKTLLAMRRTIPALTNPHRDQTRVQVDPETHLVYLERLPDIRVVMNFDLHQAQTFNFPADTSRWQKILDSTAAMWQSEHANRATAPDQIEAGTTASLQLPPKTILIYQKESER